MYQFFVIHNIGNKTSFVIPGPIMYFQSIIMYSNIYGKISKSIMYSILVTIKVWHVYNRINLK